jgi:hypothetical protein
VRLDRQPSSGNAAGIPTIAFDLAAMEALYWARQESA